MLKQTSPSTSPAAPNEVPVKTVPSSRASFAGLRHDRRPSPSLAIVRFQRTLPLRGSGLKSPGSSPDTHVRLWVFGQGSNSVSGTAKSGGFQLRRAETLLFRFSRKSFAGVTACANLGNYSGGREMRKGARLSLWREVSDACEELPCRQNPGTIHSQSHNGSATTRRESHEPPFFAPSKMVAPNIRPWVEKWQFRDGRWIIRC